MERRKSTIGIATATKAMILKNILHRRPCCSEGNLLACLTRQATALSRSVTNLQFLMGPEVQGSLPHLIPRKAGPLAMGMRGQAPGPVSLGGNIRNHAGAAPASPAFPLA
jgi:hypothetical protein